MAIHNQRVGLIRESLVEMIHVARYCITHRKTDRKIWKQFTGEGILGFPSAVILFSVIDCIGSVFRGDNNFKIIIDGKERIIKTTTQHIYILNSKYFGLNLKQIELDNIYKNIRSPLTHNSLLPSGYFLYDEDEGYKVPFRIEKDESHNLCYFVYLVPLFHQTTKAAEAFINDLDNGQVDFENSTINNELRNRDSYAKIDYFKEYDIPQITPSKKNEQ
jgi:hypothetical protein